MDLICYLHPGWALLIRPAPATRPWMDRTPESFAYRCLPLNIANAHGWEILNPTGFEAVWNGGTGADAVTVTPDAGAPPKALSLFGQGVLTFHVEGILRTPPGWDLWVTGSPNRFKDAIAPLSGVIESDWSPYTFTMNWRFTRPHVPVRFEAMEPFCFLFPVQRGAVEDFNPRYEPLESEAALQARFEEWSRSRDAFHERMKQAPPTAPSEQWQKHYFRGLATSGEALSEDHRTRLRAQPFDASAVPDMPVPPPKDPASPALPPAIDETARLRLALAKREWLLEATERQRDLAPAKAGIQRRQAVSSDDFLENHYALARPVILTDAMTDWPALKRWTPRYLKEQVGGRIIQYQEGSGPEAQTRSMAFDAFIDRIGADVPGELAYLTTYDAPANAHALAVLQEDIGSVEAVLDPKGAEPGGVMSISPAGTLTPLHHDIINTLVVQAVGRSRFKILPASEIGRLQNDSHVFSRITDLDDPDLNVAGDPSLAGARAYEFTLEPGEAVFLPFGWWRQVRALSFGVTLAYANFRWPNAAHRGYPAG